MWRAAARKVKKAPSRLTLSTRRHSSLFISANEVPPLRPLTPALAKQPSTRPSTFTVSAKAASTAASSETSHTSARTLRPVSASSAWAAAFLVGLVPQIATSAPASASARAMPRPMPLLPPVTRATLPVRSKGLYMGSLRRLARCLRLMPFCTTSGKAGSRTNSQPTPLSQPLAPEVCFHSMLIAGRAQRSTTGQLGSLAFGGHPTL